MSSSLSAMPFARQYGSFRTTSTSGSNTSPSTTGQQQHSRHSSGADGTAVGSTGSGRARFQMAGPLSGYRLANRTAGAGLMGASPGNMTTTSSSSTNSNTLTVGGISSGNSAFRQPKYPQSSPVGGTTNQENIPTTGARSTAAVVATLAATPVHGKMNHHYHNPTPTERCALHARGGVAVDTKKLSELIGDSPLLQSPRIIARSARIVEPNAWNRRLTTSNFCSTPLNASHHHFQHGSSSSSGSNGRLIQVASSLGCRKSPGSSGTSVESIVPKYSRAPGVGGGASLAAGGATGATVAQKRTHNAHKPQLRSVSSRTLANTSGRIGAVAGGGVNGVKKPGTTSATTVTIGRPMPQGVVPAAAREVAKVLHQHNGAATMRVIDLLNNNHLQHHQAAYSSSRASRFQPRPNNENHHPQESGQSPAESSVEASTNSRTAQKTPSTKKLSAIPQRLPLALGQADQRRQQQHLVQGAACFSSKFPNGLPFEQEFYYRRPPPAPGHRHSEEENDEQDEEDEENYGESEHQDVSMREEEEEEDEEEEDNHRHIHQQEASFRPQEGGHNSRKGKKVGPFARRAAPTATGQKAQQQQQQQFHHHHRRSRSESATDEREGIASDAEQQDVRYVDFPKLHAASGECRLHRRHQTRHELEQEKERKQIQVVGGEGAQCATTTSVVEYRHINHANYHYKFESIRTAGVGRHKDHASKQCKLLQRRLSQQTAGADEGEASSRRQQLRGLDGNGNGDGSDADDHYDYDDESDDDVEDADGERSTVYVAVATWVPKCNRLPVAQAKGSSSSVVVEKQKQPATAAAAMPSVVRRTAALPVPATSVHGRK
uniref:Uncharacterized protein n=1 Tax=Anopheles atroparvus TaxID=41427 RepID=A0A182IYZ4_ANOAO